MEWIRTLTDMHDLRQQMDASSVQVSNELRNQRETNAIRRVNEQARGEMVGALQAPCRWFSWQLMFCHQSSFVVHEKGTFLNETLCNENHLQQVLSSPSPV